MTTPQSPSASPRLPSPPPIAEDQTLIGPASPGVPLFEDHKALSQHQNATDNGASRRIRPGTKAEDMAEGPPVVELADIDSAFPLTEHLKALHYSHTHPSNSHTTQPLTPQTAHELSQPPPNTSREIWLYELARHLIQKTNTIIVALFADSPACSPATCPEMRASEWQYLCAVHDPPKSCAAVDYCCHTLDWAATTLTSSKTFPSRLGLGSSLGGGREGSGSGGEGGGGKGDRVLQSQLKEITNIFRRVYRIYAHAWFQHREMFWRVEARTGLYVFFKTVCDEYGLIQAENYTIPPEAENGVPEEGEREVGREGEVLDADYSLDPQRAPNRREDLGRTKPPTLLKRDPGAASETSPVDGKQLPEPVGNRIVAAGETTKRHRHTMSDRSVSSVSTIIREEDEEDAEGAEDDGRGHVSGKGTEGGAVAGGTEEGAESSDVEGGEPGEGEAPDLRRQTTKMLEVAQSLPQPSASHTTDHAPSSAPADEAEDAPAAAAATTEHSADDAAKKEAAEEVDAEELVPTGLGVARSDTIKPPKSPQLSAAPATEPAPESTTETVETETSAAGAKNSEAKDSEVEEGVEGGEEGERNIVEPQGPAAGRVDELMEVVTSPSADTPAAGDASATAEES